MTPEPTAVGAPVAPIPDITDPDLRAQLVDAIEPVREWLAARTVHELPDVAAARVHAQTIVDRVNRLCVGGEPELAAAEIARRTERRLGQLIREGQDRRLIARRGETIEDHPGMRWAVTDFASRKTLSGSRRDGIYHLCDGVTDEAFERALAAARKEGSLARFTLTRIIRSEVAGGTSASHRIDELRELAAQGHTSEQIGALFGVTNHRIRDLAKRNGIALADAVSGRRRRIDSDRIVAETVDTLAGLAIGLDLVNPNDLDPTKVDGWRNSLKASVRPIMQLIKEMIPDD